MAFEGSRLGLEGRYSGEEAESLNTFWSAFGPLDIEERGRRAVYRTIQISIAGSRMSATMGAEGPQV